MYTHEETTHATLSCNGRATLTTLRMHLTSWKSSSCGKPDVEDGTLCA